MSRSWLIGGLVLACVAIAGCQNSSPESSTAGASHGGAAEANAAGEKTAAGPSGALPKLPVLTNVEGWEGNWALVPTMQRQDLYFGLLRLARDDDGHWKAEILSQPPPPGKIEVTEVKIDDQQIHIEGDLVVPPQQQQQQGAPQRIKWDFEGVRQEGEVRGSMLLSWASGMAPARLLPTDADTLEGYALNTISAGIDEFDKVLQEPDPAHGLWKAAKSYRHSPLSLDAYNAILSQVAQSRWLLSPEELRELAADSDSTAKLWGSRLHGLTLINTGVRLSEARKSLDLAEQQLQAGEEILPQKGPVIEAMLAAARMNIRTARALAGLEADSAETAAAAYADLQKVAKERRDQLQYPELVLALAEHARRTKQNDAAIDYYITLVSLPVMEQLALATRVGAPADDAIPRRALESLWQEKHGSLDGLEAALAENYDREVAQAFEKLQQRLGGFSPADAGNHTVLVELFTNVACNPCVSAELVAEEIGRTLPKTEAIILQYHVHDPAPDPLTSMDGEARATTYYKIEGRPMAFVDGLPIPNLGGVFLSPMLEAAYRNLQIPIDLRLKGSTDIAIKPQAEVVDGKLSVNVSVEGMTEEQLSACRLRLVVAEELVNFRSSNGIRHHPMVVRTLLGGASGISAKQGVLKYALQMPLAELKSRQLGYLASYAHGRRISFDQAPVELKPLWLVAFVQNDATREVLQAAAVQISGELVYPDLKLQDFHRPHAPDDNAAAKESESGKAPSQ